MSDIFFFKGSRLTAYELSYEGLGDVATLICDDMVGHLMKVKVGKILIFLVTKSFSC